jgi:hypothetical protein
MIYKITMESRPQVVQALSSTGFLPVMKALGLNERRMRGEPE